MESSLIRNVLRVFKTYRYRFLSGLFLICISNGLLIANPLVLRQAVTDMQLESHYSVWLWALVLFVITCVSAVLKYLMRVQFIIISRKEETLIRSKLFERIQNQTMEFFGQHGIGELMSRLTNDISSYREVLGPGLLYPIYFTTLVIPGFAALFYISPQMAVLAFIPLFAIPLLNVLLRKKVYNASRVVQETLGEVSDKVQEDYAGIKIIKSYGVEDDSAHLFSQWSEKLKNLEIRLFIFEGIYYPLLTLVTRVTTVLLVLFAGAIIYHAWTQLTAADFISFMWIQAYIYFPIMMLGWVMPIYEQGRAAYDRLLKIYQEPIHLISNLHPGSAIDPESSITFNDLTFTYPGRKEPALKNFSLQIESGSFVGITGPTGAGKTTLFRLLNREYEVPEGMIHIGSHEIHDYPLEAFSKQLVSVEQIPFLFSKSIAENVRFALPEASQAELESVAKFVDLHETVMTFPSQYETMVGERGVTLSGGQKQRVAMARAFLVNRSILLLDDIFAAVDAETEKHIFDSILNNFKGKTVILVTHRATVLERLDRVVYMREGSVLEDGSPAELRNMKGYYATLVELQMKDRHER